MEIMNIRSSEVSEYLHDPNKYRLKAMTRTIEKENAEKESEKSMGPGDKT